MEGGHGLGKKRDGGYGLGLGLGLDLILLYHCARSDSRHCSSQGEARSKAVAFL